MAESEKTKLLGSSSSPSDGGDAPTTRNTLNLAWKMLILAILLVMMALFIDCRPLSNDSANVASVLQPLTKNDDDDTSSGVPPDGTVLLDGFDSLVDSSANKDSESALQWYCAPDSWNVSSLTSREGYGGSWKLLSNHQLRIHAPAKKDFWRKTFYSPLLIKDDGPVAFTVLNTTRWYTLTTSFTLTAIRQFDQAGMYLRLSRDHWIKTGIEVVDHVPRLSVVVTNVYSDWSTQAWPDYNTTISANNETVTVVSCQIRLHVRGNDFVVEAKHDDEWSFVRIAHLASGIVYPNDPIQQGSANDGPSPPRGKLWAGVFAASPQDQQGSFVDFHDLVVAAGSSFDHNADDNA